MRLRDDRPGPFGRRAAHPQPLRLHDLAVPRGRTELLGHQDYLLLREYAENEKSVGSSVRKPPWWPPKRNGLRPGPDSQPRIGRAQVWGLLLVVQIWRRST